MNKTRDGTSQFCTTGEAAKALGVSIGTISGMVKRGELNGAKKIGKWWRIPVKSVEAFGVSVATKKARRRKSA